MMSASAFGPPVDTPMTTAATVAAGDGYDRTALVGTAAAAGAARSARRSGISSSRTSDCAMPMPSALGFSANPVAPRASASSVAAAPAAVRWLKTTTGSAGSARRISFSVSKPSITGMSRSRSTRSG